VALKLKLKEHPPNFLLVGGMARDFVDFPSGGTTIGYSPASVGPASARQALTLIERFSQG